jgi:hypothetical protein
MSDLGPCIECAKDKQTSMHKYTANRMMNVLELIHTDICGPFPTTTRNDHVYFLIGYQLRQQIKLHMNCGLDENLVSNILEFEVVQLKLGLIGHKRRSLMKGLLAVILSDM